MTDNDAFLKRVIADLYLVAKHVASQPSGYAGFEVERARYLLDSVDVDALSDTLQSVLFVSGFLRQFGPLSATERQVEQAAQRLDGVQRSIRIQQSEIQARMAA